MTEVTMRPARAATATAADASTEHKASVAPLVVGDDADDSPEAKIAAFLATIPNYTLKPGTSKLKIRGTEYETLAVQFGEPRRTIQLRRLDVADEWDLVEIAAGAGQNAQWLMMARAAASVVSVDGAAMIPGAGGLSRLHLRNVMQAVGNHGLNAVIAATAGLEPKALADNTATAKNS